MSKFALLFILASLFANSISATTSKVYVWRNEKGQLVFSDSPRPGSEEMSISQSNNIISSSIDTSILDIKPKKIEEEYQIAISQPENHATIRDNTGSVYIAGQVMPIFKKGMKVRLLLDNAPYEKASDRAIFSLRNIDRGEHQIKMELINEEGKVIASSKAVTFYMHRATVN
jgi:hypothetical protein